MASYTPEPANFWEWIEYSALGASISESLWAFPTLETIHIIALVTLFGTILVMDLRLLGAASTNVAITSLRKDVLPWIWGAFVLAAISASLMFVSNASSYVTNTFFLFKLGLLAVAGLNMIYFQFVALKTVSAWDASPILPRRVKVAALVSLILWIGVIFCGRAIGFTLQGFYT